MLKVLFIAEISLPATVRVAAPLQDDANEFGGAPHNFVAAAEIQFESDRPQIEPKARERVHTLQRRFSSSSSW
jgi:hypothetical protein